MIIINGISYKNTTTIFISALGKYRIAETELMVEP